MATQVEIFNLRNNENLKSRAASALAKAAEDIRNEALATTNHAERFSWAQGILLTDNGPEKEATRVMWLLLQNTDVASGYTVNPDGSTVTDNDIQFAINGLVDILAGIDIAV